VSRADTVVAWVRLVRTVKAVEFGEVNVGTAGSGRMAATLPCDDEMVLLHRGHFDVVHGGHSAGVVKQRTRQLLHPPGWIASNNCGTSACGGWCYRRQSSMQVL
jgi:hypothetical protein